MSEDKFSQVKYFGKSWMLSSFSFRITVLADFDSPHSTSTSNVKIKYKSQRHFGMYGGNSFGIRSCFYFWPYLSCLTLGKLLYLGELQFCHL